MLKPICLITGATEGIGRATAIGLAAKGFTVVLAARNAAKAEAVVKEIEAITGRCDAEYITGDLRSLSEVRALAETFHRRYPRLDVLINNAGIFSPARIVTGDGFEATYQVNYLSQFYLTHLLLDALKQSNQGRIINLSSNAYSAGKFDPGNLQSEKRFSTIASYAASKLLMLMFTVELADRLRNTRVTANAVHPGVVNTHMLKSATGLFKLIAILATPFAIAPDKGAVTSIYLASSPDVQGISGKYFARCKEAPIKTAFNTRENRERLWNLSMQSLRLAETPGG
jgi:NAD(P)-dependent dehydrogenase (short-subunit alcohol dehydrogenase family)